MVELMITLAILALVMVLGMPSYSTWILNTRARTAAESVQNGLQLARVEAIRRNVSTQFTLLGDDTDWEVGCVTVTVDCPAVIQKRSSKDGSSSAIELDETPAGNKIVAFSSLGTVQAAPAPFSRLDISIDPAVLSSGGRPLRITLGVGGNVRLCDPGVSSPDIRAC
jgi:type IV fimbrial biogenesis protein FimT